MKLYAHPHVTEDFFFDTSPTSLTYHLFVSCLKNSTKTITMDCELHGGPATLTRSSPIGNGEG